jgi:hypothetical protein
MISLAELKTLNNRAAKGALKIRDNFNRDSSACFSAVGVVIHSGVHRSTAFISATNPEFSDSYFAASYWLKQEQSAVNGFIETIIDGGSLEDAEREAFRRSRPDWSVQLPKSKGTQGNRQFTAIAKRGGFETRVGAFTWRHLHARTGKGEA